MTWPTRPPRPLLTPEAAAAVLRECVTVVRPGETLVMRAPAGWTPEQIEHCQQYFDAMKEWRDLNVALLFLPGEEFAVITQDATVNEVRKAAGLDPVTLPPPHMPETTERSGSGSQRCRCSVVPAD